MFPEALSFYRGVVGCRGRRLARARKEGRNNQSELLGEGGFGLDCNAGGMTRVMSECSVINTYLVPCKVRYKGT